MKLRAALLLIVALLALVLRTSAPAAQALPGPDIKLVLLIAVDQFRYDYLTKFRPDYREASSASSPRAPFSPTPTWNTTRP